MVKIILFLAMLLFLSACANSVIKENGELPPPPEEVGVSTADIESDNDATDKPVMHICNDISHEFNGNLYDETFDMPDEVTHQPYDPYGYSELHKKYFFSFLPRVIDGVYGYLVNNWWSSRIPFPTDWDGFYEPATRSTISSDFSSDFIIADDGRLIVLLNSGWPGPLRDPTYEVDEDMEIMVFILQDHMGPLDSVDLVSRQGVLTQIPEFWEDDLLYDLELIRANGNEVQRILYEERETSRLWQWLMDEENAWRITVPDPRPFSDIFRDVSGDLWDRYNIQIFLYGGDATVMTRHGILTKIPEWQEDNFHFDLYTSGDFEMQYIMLHEQAESGLWQFLIDLRGVDF